MTRAPYALTIPVTDGVPATLTVTLHEEIAAGTLLRLRAGGLTMLRGLHVGRVRALDHKGLPDNNVALDIVHRFSREAMQRDWMWHLATLSLAVVEVPRSLGRGSQIEIETVPGDGLRVADLDWMLFVGIVGAVEDVSFTRVADPLTLHFVAGPVDHLGAVLKPDGAVLVEQFDRFGNPAEPSGEDELTLTLGGTERTAAAIQCVAATTFSAVEETELALGVRGRVRDEHGRRTMTNAWPRALDGTPIFFGECHWHTDFSSDGQRSLVAALTSARDELGLDFAGPADHLSPDGTYAHRLPIELAEIAQRFDDPGRFSVVPGAELSGRYGHANLYAADFDTFLAIVRRFPHELLPAWREMPDSYPLEVLSALCPEGKALIVPHHTNMDSSVREGVVGEDGRPFWCAMHWPLVTPLLQQGLRLVEMVQNRGAFETEAPDPEWRVHWGGFGGSVQTALMRGHRLGFIGGTDNHTGWPTRLYNRQGTGGLTAVQAPALDGTMLFDALFHRRCYATSGARIVADASLNGVPLGGELKLAPGAPREFEVRIHGTVPLVAVQIISMGVVLADLPVTPDSPDLVTTWADDRPGRPLQDVYYYVRARQSDGHCAWLSPWWVDLAEENNVQTFERSSV